MPFKIINDKYWGANGDLLLILSQLTKKTRAVPGNGNKKSTSDSGNANGYFLCVPKFPSVDSMRMQSNKIL